jgi:hypothetical protein
LHRCTPQHPFRTGKDDQASEKEARNTHQRAPFRS